MISFGNDENFQSLIRTIISLKLNTHNFVELILIDDFSHKGKFKRFRYQYIYIYIYIYI